MNDLIKFPINLDEPVITTKYVVDDGLPVLYVSHEYDPEASSEGSWQFHCGNDDYSGGVLRLVKLETILESDQTIFGICDLKVGFGAKRESVGSPWTIFEE